MTIETPQRSGVPPLRIAVAEEIRALLGRREISRIELGRRIGKSHMYIGRRVSGELPFDIDDLEQIAHILGVSVSSLIRRDGGATEGYAPTGPRVDPLAVRVVAVGGQPNRRTRSVPKVRQFHPAGRTGRPAEPAMISRPVTPVAAG